MYKRQKAHGLIDEVAVRKAYLDAILAHNGYPTGRINSGRRTVGQQRELQVRRAAGEPGIGPVACRSWHTLGRAFDATYPAQSRVIAGLIWEWLGGRWGGRFSDPEDWHFDLPGPVPPPNIC